MKTCLTLIIIGGPNEAGQIVVTNASGSAGVEIPLIGSSLAEVVNDALQVDFKLRNIEALSGNNLTQYTFIKCMKCAPSHCNHRSRC